MSYRKPVRALQIALGAVVLSLAVIGATVAFGLLRDGPSFLLFAYDKLAEFDDPEPLVRIVGERSSARHRSRQPAQAGPPDGQLVDDPAPRPPLLEAPAPRRLPAEQTALRIADLPPYDPVSGFGLELAALERLAVDYVSVPPKRHKRVTEDSPVRLRFRPLAGPRVLVLAGQPGLSWQFEGEVPAGIVAVLVAAPEASEDDSLFGLPDSIPALRVNTARNALPFMLSALPDCTVKADPRRRFKCSNVRRDRSGQQRTPFRIAEQQVGVLLGADIATVSAAFADNLDRMILVPEEIVDQAVRERARRDVARHDEAVAAAARHKETLKDYARRWVEDRRDAVLEEVARHPPYSPAQVVARQPDVLIVSAHEGASTQKGNRRGPRPVRSYQEFVDRENLKVGTIIVDVSATEPTVIIATAARPVDWRFEFAQGAKVLAVHVEGVGAPAVTGVPRDVPLTVRSNAYGDRKVAARVRVLTNLDGAGGEISRIRADLERFRDMYPGSALVIYSEYRLDRAQLTN